MKAIVQRSVSQQQTQQRSWKLCIVCEDSILTFKTPVEFSQHLREVHCSKEGGSFVCKYGYNGVCSSLPLEGVSDRDYEEHVARHHIFQAASGKFESEKNFGTSVGNPSARDAPNVIQMSECGGRWTVYDSTQNLPAVLNDPQRGKQRDFFTKTWGDSFVERSDIPPCPFLPDIGRVHFENYLRRTSKRFQRHKSRSSLALNSPLNADQTDRPSYTRAASLLAEKSQQDLDSIPKMFFQSTFSLTNPETFSSLYPWLPKTILQESMQPNVAKNNNHSVKLLQEKLSHYLDIVEVQIARQIALRSDVFFHAMLSHDALMEQLSTTGMAVKVLRDKINFTDQVLVRGSLRPMKSVQQKQNYMAVFSKLKLMSVVHQTQPTVQMLLSTSDFAGALDLISTTQEVLDKELQGIHSFRHLGSQLAELEKVINKMMQTDFVRYATSDLNRPLDDREIDVLEEERLVSMIFGMLRQGQHSFPETYRDESCVTIKALVKQTVAEMVSKADSADTESYLRRLAEQMRLLGFAEWLDLLKQIFRNLLKILHRIQSVVAVMIDAVDVAAGKACCPNSPLHERRKDIPEVSNMAVTVDGDLNGVLSEDDHTKLKASLSGVMGFVCDQADDRCAKVFTARGKDAFFESLSCSEFVLISRAVEEFVQSCEKLSGRRSTQLQLSLQCQANSFISRFHNERKTKLGLLLDKERWRQADVPFEFQHLVDSLTHSSGILGIPKRIPQNGDADSKRARDYLCVNGEKFVVIGTVLMLLKMMFEYCQFVSDVPCVAVDILTRLVELLKLFNSRTCQLILGAGALQISGLKTISTKNLALASRCLQLVILLICKTRDHFEKFLIGKHQNRIRQFEQVLKVYSDHIDEIFSKLLSIVEHEFTNQFVTWAVKPPVPSNCFSIICKQLVKLHEAIAEVFPPDQVHHLYVVIHAAFKRQLRDRLQKLNVSNDGGPKHGLVTSELAFYVKSLQSLGCFTSEDDLSMDDVWEPMMTITTISS